MSVDHVNACFELVGSVLLWLNVRRLWRDRTVLGVSVWPSVFFCTWGLWNLFYYWALHQPVSLAASVGMLAAHFTWLAMAIVFLRRRS